jgi:hypothetical protein
MAGRLAFALSSTVPQERGALSLSRKNMEIDLQSLFGLHVHSCTHWLIPRNPHPPPRIWAHVRGRYWSAKIDISL